jgi:uncharacterized membrane protein
VVRKTGVRTHSTRSFRRAIDRAAIEAAIRRVRETTTGDIAVVIAPAFWGSVRHNAERLLRLLRLGSSAHRNGVVLLIVPRRRSFAIFGDAGIHERSGEELWREARDGLAAAFREGRYTEGVVEAVERIGRELARHFPRSAT